MTTLPVARRAVQGAPARREKLFFGQGNAKLDSAIFTFSLPAGHTCPYARLCLAKASRDSGELEDGPDTEVRCYAASMENRRPNVRASRWRNFDLLRKARTKERMVALILASLSPFAGYVRVHDSGDFWSQTYYDAWLEVARQRPRSTLFFYTKALPFWVRRLQEVGDGHTPGEVPNFIPTASTGGRRDDLITAFGLRFAHIVKNEEEAKQLWLEVDHSDACAARHGPDFALVVHGPQPAGSEMMRAVTENRKRGWFGYGKTSRRVPLALA